jgi:hypothetical protein
MEKPVGAALKISFGPLMKLQRQFSGGAPLWTKTCDHDLEEALPVERRQG